VLSYVGGLNCLLRQLVADSY